MKRGSMAAMLLCIMSTAFSQQKFIVKGKLTDVNLPAKVFLSYRDNETPKKDSVVSTNGVFRFSGTVANPVRAYLEVKAATAVTSGKRLTYDGQELFLEKGTVNVTGSNARTAIITGGKSQSDLNRLTIILKPLKEQASRLSEKLLNSISDTTGRGAFMAQYNVINLNSLKAEDDFIHMNPDSYVSLSLLQARANYIQPASFEPLYNGLSTSVKSSEPGKALGLRLEIVKKTGVGSPAIDFTQNTLENKPFTLSSLKGKFVLIDFWASWCGPCRGENPFVLEAYRQFKDKNFEVVGVSLDDRKEPWVKAIEKDSLPWIHVSDLKGWMNEVAVTYGIRAIPRNFLLNPNGIIIAKNLRGEELAKKLAEVIR